MSEYDLLIVGGAKQGPLTEIEACEDTGIRCAGECPVHNGDRCIRVYYSGERFAKLEQERDRLREICKRLAVELEEEVCSRYGVTSYEERDHIYTTLLSRFDRDMDAVLEANEILKEDDDE